MSNRSAYIMTAWLLPFIVAFELTFTIGPAADGAFEGYWQIWHPYYIQLLGLVGVPIFFGYIIPLARRLGGRQTAYGGFLWYQMFGTMAFILAGPTLNFIYLTCPKNFPGACSHQLGEVSAPSVLDIGFLAFYPFVAYGLAKLMTGLGTTWRTSFAKYWYVPLVYTVLAAVVVAPFGFDVIFKEGQSNFQNVVELAYVACSIVLVSMTTFTVIQTRKMGGGVFYRPIVFMSIGMFIISVGAFARLHWTGTPTEYNVQDPAIAPYTIGFVMWIVAVMMLGARVERMLGLGGHRESSDDAAGATA